MSARDQRTNIHDPIQFGMKWQVRDSISTPSQEPQHPKQCILPSPLRPAVAASGAGSSLRQRRLGEKRVTRNDAELACGRINSDWEGIDFQNCVFGVLPGNDLVLAYASFH